MEQADYSEQEHGKPSSNQNPIPTPKTKRNDQTKRFSDEQVKLLESRFNRQAKLEPRSKLQLAKDLGLQPRQVSIWFQNKRARWKSKKLEQEYRVLRANFDDLNQQFQSVKKENESLLEQLDKLKNLPENSQRRQKTRKDSNENILPNTAPADSDKNNFEHRGNGNSVCISEHLGQKEEEAKFDELIEQGESSFASPNQRCNLVRSGPMDESCCPSSWWDF